MRLIVHPIFLLVPIFKSGGISLLQHLSLRIFATFFNFFSRERMYAYTVEYVRSMSGLLQWVEGGT